MATFLHMLSAMLGLNLAGQLITTRATRNNPPTMSIESKTVDPSLEQLAQRSEQNVKIRVSGNSCPVNNTDSSVDNPLGHDIGDTTVACRTHRIDRRTLNWPACLRNRCQLEPRFQSDSSRNIAYSLRDVAPGTLQDLGILSERRSILGGLQVH
jgi:hypothetical protein